jgi:[acyl-carrier-protein] S-malonyltransferase
MKKAFVFPGQGSQSVGMGKELYDGVAGAREVFDEVDDALNEKLSGLIFNGPGETLNLTANLQPAIFAVSMAMWKAAGEPACDFVAGHSLGEYSALCVAGAISVSDCARLLRKRGELMQAAAPEGIGAAAVVIGDIDLDSVCAEAAETAAGVCEIANNNAPGQTVISGNRPAVEKALEIAKSKGARIAKMLPLSVPVHCSLMQPAVRPMAEAVAEAEWRQPKIKFISNKTADIMDDLDQIKESLTHQLTHGVRWRESILFLGTLGVGEIVEIGPGSVLTGLCGRIAPDANCRKLEI